MAARTTTVGALSPGLRDRLAAALAAAGLPDGVLESGSSSPGGPSDSRPLVALSADPVDEMRQALDRALEAAARADHLAVRAAGPSPAWLARALESFLRPDPVLRAATEILVMSQFDEGLSAAIGTTLGDSVSQWCSPSRRDATDAARCAYLVSTAFGLLLARTRAGVAELRLMGEAELLFAALTSDATPSLLPQEAAEHLGRFLDFDTGDPALDALLRATLEEVGRAGFDAATTAGIGRASGYSEGLLFARYPSKVEVFVDATRRQHAQNWRLNEAFQRGVIAAHGEGIAEAVVIREFQRPHLSLARAIHLEQVRLALHDERLRQVQWGELDALVAESTASDPTWHPAASPAHLHLSVAIGLGAACLPMLVPDAWQLPYDVVTVPFNEPGGPAAAPSS
ncbi:MAG: TetR/AcrR family transcriptional regulator [Actinomycetales bacterium]|nr:TetR/AcrR family transcriptional regulator [Actinomycetales bacterium]